MIIYPHIFAWKTYALMFLCQRLITLYPCAEIYALMFLGQKPMLLCPSVKYKKKEQPLRIALLFCCPIRTRTLNYRTKTWRVANYTMGQTSSAFSRKTVQNYEVILIWARWRGSFLMGWMEKVGDVEGGNSLCGREWPDGGKKSGWRSPPVYRGRGPPWRWGGADYSE